MLITKENQSTVETPVKPLEQDKIIKTNLFKNFQRLQKIKRGIENKNNFAD